jgi:competence protein ComEC
VALPGLLGVLLVRRWVVTVLAATLFAGFVVGALHAAAVERTDLRPGEYRDVEVVLTSTPRDKESATGTTWSARGTVTGPLACAVTLGGRGVLLARTGDSVTATANVGQPWARGTAAHLQVRGEPVVAARQDPAADFRAAMRRAAGDGDPGWLLSGMTLGLDHGLSEPAQDSMRDAGLTHLTAVSGANCAVLLIVVRWACGWMRIPRWPRALVCLAFLAAFVAVVGREPSVLRASLMTGLAVVAGLVGGKRASAHVLHVSVIALLLIDPWLGFSVAFMLSVAATAGLIAVLDRGLLAATMAAQIATFPILLAIGGTAGPRTVVANLLVAPVAAAVPVVGMLASTIEWAAGWGGPLGGLGRGLCRVVLAVASVDVLPGLAWAPGAAGVALAAAIAAAAFTMGRHRFVVVGAGLIGVVSLSARLSDPWPPPGWWLVACDVGQGDAFVVRAGQSTVLVDTGPDPDAVDACLDRLGVDSIDLLVLTHFHADHVDGLAGALQGRRVGGVWVSLSDDPQEQHTRAAAGLGGLPVTAPVPGTVASVGPMTARVLWPERIIHSGSIPNNASVCVMVTTPHGRVALLGDVETQAQAAILAGGDLSADVVKVPHHGSADFHEDLPAAVSPRVALIGVGEDNTFGHPAPEAVAAWSAVGAGVYATSENGDIALTPDGVVVRGVSRRTAR